MNSYDADLMYNQVRKIILIRLSTGQKSLGNYIIHQKTVTECKKLLNEVTKENQLNLHWIPSHIGHRGNEIADRLAKLGTGTNTYGPALLLPVPISTSHTKQVLNNWAMVNHQTQWANREDCRQSRMAMPNTGIKIWNTLQNLNRRQMKERKKEAKELRPEVIHIFKLRAF